MNTQSLEEAIKGVPAVEKLKMVVRPSGAGTRSREAILTIAHAGQNTRYDVQARTDVSTTVVNMLLSRLADPSERGRVLVYAPYINPTCAERLRQHGIAFLDDCGNAFLRAPGLYLFVAGRQRQQARGGAEFQAMPTPRPLKTATLKMIYAILADPALDHAPPDALINRPYRGISERTGLSLGSVSNAMEDLLATGYVIERTPTRRMLVNRRKLFERWVQDYGSRLRPKLVAGHFRAPSPRWWQGVTLTGDQGLWGGEVAGAKLTSFLTPETATIYTERLPDEFVLAHDLRRDPAGGVEVLKPFWRSGVNPDKPDCVHALVVYADLTASDIDRNIETAQRVYERHLRSVIEAA